MANMDIQPGTILMIPRVRAGFTDSYVIGMAEKVTDGQIRLKSHPRQPSGWFPVFVNRPANVIPITEGQVDFALAMIRIYTDSVAQADEAQKKLRADLVENLTEAVSQWGQDVG